MALFIVSLDTAEKNAEFAASLDASFLPVVSDPKGVVAKQFGVLGVGGLWTKRWTFYIDVDGRVAAIDKKVSTKTAGADMIEQLEALGMPKKAMTSAPAPPVLLSPEPLPESPPES